MKGGYWKDIMSDCIRNYNIGWLKHNTQNIQKSKEINRLFYIDMYLFFRNTRLIR